MDGYDVEFWTLCYILCCTVLYVLYYTVLYCTVLYCTVLYQGVVSAVIALTSLAWLGLPETDSWLGLGHPKDESKEDDEVETGDSAGDGKEDEVETGEQTGPEYGSFSVTFILAICWMTISVLYYGLSLPADTIHITDNLYVAFVTSALIELPFQVILPFPADILGRRYVFSFIQIVPGIVCVVVRFLSPGSDVFSSLTLLAKGTVAAAKTLGTRLFKIFFGPRAKQTHSGVHFRNEEIFCNFPSKYQVWDPYT